MAKKRKTEKQRRQNAKRKASASQKKKRERDQRIMTLRGRVEKSMCVLDVVVSNVTTGKAVTVPAIVDTGCTSSCINPQIADQLGLPLTGHRDAHTANGLARSKLVIARITIGTGEHSAARMIELAVPDELAAPMLFGMEALEGGVLTIDMPNGKWEWRMKAHKP